jgi:GNAT superfamily N-acetyltransferase
VGGLLVRPDRRDEGIGGHLLAHLADWARARGHTAVWVATGGRAIRFYERCGWVVRGSVTGETGEIVTLLAKVLA